MHERRNLILAVLFGVAALYGLFAWLIVPDAFPNIAPSVLAHKMASLASILILGAMLFYVMQIEDRLDDELGEKTMGHYFERDGLCVMPVVRVRKNDDGKPMAEVSVYYQSRFSGVAEAVVHLRPPPKTVFSHRGARDLHFAFQAQPGGFGVIHQPVAVFRDSQGQPVTFEIALAVRWPRGVGDQLRSKKGQPCGTFKVDWAKAYRQSRHEMCGEIEIMEPASVTLTMPDNVVEDVFGATYTQESFSAYEPEGVSHHSQSAA